MKSRVTIIITVLFLATSVASAMHFQKLIIDKYSLFEELVLTLKTGQELNNDRAKEARQQGTIEAYVQLGAYTLSIIVLVLCSGALVKQLHITSHSRPTQ